MPALNEELSIGPVVSGYLSESSVKEVIVIDNNSTDNTAEIATLNGAKVLSCLSPGLGSALKLGIAYWKDSTSESSLLLVESDGTFSAKDVSKFLAYAPDAEIVLGSRTSRSLIWDGAYMPHWVRLGNWFVAKLTEFLYNGPSLTDIGCTSKLIKHGSLDRIDLSQFTDSSHFNEQFLVSLLEAKVNLVEIPLNYMPRIGQSKITGNNFYRTLQVGCIMVFDILYHKIRGKWIK
jgi:glycosyltransferase involved in cell wall biosynthesis